MVCIPTREHQFNPPLADKVITPHWVNLRSSPSLQQQNKVFPTITIGVMTIFEELRSAHSRDAIGNEYLRIMLHRK